MNQEEIVDNIIFEELEVKEPGSGELILNKMTKSTRRDLMLRILGNDRQLYIDYAKIVKKNPPYACAEYSAKIVQLLGEYIKVANKEVKKYGEVMTPLTLVNEMLDTLPKEVWSNPNLKWLDPCNGIGRFPSVVVERLMIGLKDVIVNDCDRYRHIIENMIYVCEIQAKNMFLFHCAFDKEDNYVLNTYFGSFLTDEFNEHMTNVWGVEKFDIVIGNPPYQTSSDEKKKTTPIWHHFVVKSFSFLNENGYMCMVHPDGWRKVDGKFKQVQNILKTKQVLYLELHDTKDGIKTFGAGTTYDFYCVRNVENKNFITKIKCVDGVIENIDLGTMDFIPNGKFSEFNKIMAKNSEERVQIINDYSYGVNIPQPHMSNNMVGDFKYPCVYTTLKDGTINTRYTNDKTKGHFGIPKVIWSNGSATSVIIDKNGTYGLTQHSYGLVDNRENLECIKKALISPKFLELISFSDGGTHKYNHKTIGTFRKDFWKEFVND